ncbi:type II secretion system minor pseudopilin GspJ [Acinetobacter sp. TY1]|uniref:type II secretion system minor pseudopilin GspJ n=1 Tax=Acinetobacter sp. TY1 TaxID=3387626 RepID=UPI003AF4C22B
MKIYATSRKGFTLVELLVAIAIFAVLSALGWKVFDYLIQVKDRNAVHEANIGQLQQAYQQMQRDTLQLMPVTANIAGDVQPALSLSNQQFTFSKAGVTDPLKQGRSAFERIEYQYNAQDKKIYRLKYNNLNRLRTEQPLSAVLLSDVDQFEVMAMNPTEINQWPATAIDAENLQYQRLLPRGIRVRFTIREIEYEWLFSLLNIDFILQQAQNNQNGIGGSGNQSNSQNGNNSQQGNVQQNNMQNESE